VVDAREPGQTLDFLGYSFRYDRDIHGRPWRYWNPVPSRGALQRERDTLRRMTGSEQCFTPMPELIGRINRQMQGWANYFSIGYPRMARRHINRYVRERLTRHAKRRSQRGYKPAEGVSFHEHFKKMGLVYLWIPLSNAFRESRMREICMSGSTRGRAANGLRLVPVSRGPLSTLLVRLQPWSNANPPHPP